MYALRKMIQRDFLNLLFNPTWLFFCLLFPFLLVVIVGFMTKGMYGTQVTSYDYYGVTLMAYAALYSGTFSANSFMEERIKQANLRSLHAPISANYIPFSKAIATFLYTSTIYSLVSLILSVIFQINYGAFWLPLWLLFLGINLVSNCVGVLMCCVFKSEGVANQLLSIMTNLVAITAGLMLPVAMMGETFSRFSQRLPLTKIIHLAFELIYDRTQANVSVTLLGLLFVASCLLLASFMLFKGEDYV